ncbi:MAG: transglycosylase domain-containing protein [Ramlibacter sp.]
MTRVVTQARATALRLWQWARAHPWRAVALLPALAVLYVLVLIPFTPSIGDISRARTEKPATVVSLDNKVLATYQRINRDWVKLPAISPPVVQALIATEDHRFYEHHGIDVRRTVGAVLHTLTGDRQGGSTITQQLARNLYPEQIGRSVSITRKLREAITALKIEAVYSKDEILESYLNTVPFLYNAHGIEMAARTYFDKGAGKLDVLEAATLIGMLKGTAYYNPVTQPERSLQRRNIVLAQMAKHGKLSDKQLELLKKRPLKLDFERQPEALGPAPHLSRQLRRFLIDWADRNGYDIYSDGLVVRTTIDSRLQAMAVQAVARQGDSLQRLADGQWGPRSGFAPNRPLVQELLRETPQYKAAREAGQTEAQALKSLGADAALMKSLREEKARLSAGFMALDPRNGQVRAWVGSRDFVKDQFDHVAQARRQPGSTFKPFVYGAAFEQGMSPGEVLMDEPVEIALGGGQVWRPTDGGEPSYLPMTLRDGLAQSRNTITAQVVNRVGAQRVAALARAMGVRQSKLEEVLSLALGTSPVTLREMVAAYGTLANGGNYIEPTVILQVEDRDGKVLEAFAAPAPEPALPQPAADRLLDALRGAIDRGTGASIRGRFGIQADVAGKTGTTQDNTDGWFILMHPHLVAGAWVGFNDSRLTMSDGYGQGARSALPMVGDFFQAALRTRVLDGQAAFSAPRESFAPAEPPPASIDPGGFSSANGGTAPGFGGGVPAEAMVGVPNPAPQPVVTAPVAQPPAARIISIPPMDPQQGTRIIGIPPQANP